MTEGLFFGITAALTIINILILGLNLKLYTEYFKDISQRRRKE